MVTLKLRDPVELGEEGQPVTELRFREKVVAGDMRGIVLRESGEMTWDEHLKLVSRLSGQPEPLINRLGIDDTLKAVAIVSGFFAKGSQATGKPPSSSSPEPSTSPSPSSGS